MFEAICFRDGATPDGKIDFGLLAEALVFYGQVHFVSNFAGYRELLRVIGPHETLELIRRKQLQIHVGWNQVGVRTLDIATGRERHELAFIALEREAAESHKKAEPEAIAQREFLIATGGSDSRREAKEFASLLHYIRKPGFDLRPIHETIMDEESFSRTMVAWLRHLAPGVLDIDSKINTWDLAGYIQVAPNFDLKRVAHEIEKRGIKFDGTTAWLLANYVSAYEDSYFASQLTAEVSASVVRSPLIQIRFEHLWQRASKSLVEISAFEEETLKSGRAIGEALQSAAASWGDLLKVLEQRDRFRKWIADKPFDADLVSEYFRDLTRESWIDRLPNKAMRWALVAGAGALVEAIAPHGVGTVAALGLGALDALLVDHFLKGWKPDQFVNGALVPFVRGSRR